MPKGIQKILQKCLLPNPNDRYQDIVDFISDVSAYLNSPAIEIESKGHDKISELSEEIKQVQNTLIPSSAPEWPGVEIGLGYHLGLGISGVYVDFFELPNGCYGVFLTESATRGAEE